MFLQLNFIILISIVRVQAVPPHTLDDLMDDKNDYPGCQHNYPDYPHSLGRNNEEHAKGDLYQT